MATKRPLVHVSSFDEVFSDSRKNALATRKLSFEKRAIIVRTTSSDDNSIENQLDDRFKHHHIDLLKVTETTKPGSFVLDLKFDAGRNINEALEEIRRLPFVAYVKERKLSATESLDTIEELPWFPRNLQDLDECSKNVLMYGSELDHPDHPSFKDKEYRKRRQMFTDVAMSYKSGEPLPRISYTEEENRTWAQIFEVLMELIPKHASKKYNYNLKVLIKESQFTKDRVPQLADISEFLKESSGFEIRPVAGFLSPRDFLAALAFRVFNSTQYIRHWQDPFYTPEPDVVHELLGHVPLLCDPEFAEFSQMIGLASLGATDEEISELAAVYLFTVEFGMCIEEGETKAFGAGLLSSIEELKHAMSSPEKIKEFYPEDAAKQEFFVTKFQPVYFRSPSFEIAKSRLMSFVESMERNFQVRYHSSNKTISVHHKKTALST